MDPARLSPTVEAIVCIILCVLTGLCGSRRWAGFLGAFLIALITTPLVVLPVPILIGSSRRVEWQMATRDDHHLDELDLSVRPLSIDEDRFVEQRSVENS